MRVREEVEAAYDNAQAQPRGLPREFGSDSEGSGGDDLACGPPLDRHEWWDYMSVPVTNLWYAMQESLQMAGTPLLDRCTLTDFQDFCYRNSCVRDSAFYSRLMSEP